VRIFLDANIVFLAGYSSTSPVHDLLALARHDDCGLVTSSYAFEEARRNLAVKGPSDGSARLERAASLIALVGEAHPTALQAADQAQLGDPSDVPILAAAIQCRADVLVSGDRRAFGALYGSRVSHVEILMLRAVLQRIVGED
jgi:predicted nucleic acid-binding protein